MTNNDVKELFDRFMNIENEIADRLVIHLLDNQNQAKHLTV